MEFCILQPVSASRKRFIEYWSSQYSYGNEHVYTENIGKEMTEERTLLLFEWKNGKPLSGRGLKSVYSNYINSSVSEPTSYEKENIYKFLRPPGGAIWNIFWLHCLKPADFPIYDQHVHRAMASIEGWQEIEIPQSNGRKVDAYLDHFMPFSQQFKAFDQRTVDKALWAYGKFLSLKYRML